MRVRRRGIRASGVCYTQGLDGGLLGAAPADDERLAVPEMPEFAMQLEKASGLPWWCLLLLVVLAVVVIVLAVALHKARRRRFEQGGIVIPKAPATGEDPLDAAGSPADGVTGGQSLPPEGAAEDVPPEEVPEGASADEAEEEIPADEAVADDPGGAEAEDGAATAEASAEEVVVALDSDDGLLKATGGSHARLGHSAFGVDFGFLEEYEESYEQAVEEFRRFREQMERESQEDVR